MPKTKKKNPIIVYLALGILLLFLFTNKSTAPLIESGDVGVQDQGVSFDVLTYDADKQLMGELEMNAPTQAIVTFPGGIPQMNVEYIKIRSTISISAGNAPAVITDITGSNAPGSNLYGPALSNYNKQFTLKPGTGPNIQTSNFIHVTELLSGDIEFRMDVTAHYLNATAEEVAIPAYGTIIVNIKHNVCDDGTINEQCSIVNRGKYCLDGNLIDGATTNGCGCCLPSESIPCGWTPNPNNNDICSGELCGDGTQAGQCIESTKGTYYPMFCESDGTQTDACNRCGQCADDVYGHPSLGCSLGIDPATCKYKKYSASIEIALGGGKKRY